MKRNYECIAYRNGEIVYRTTILAENKDIALSEFAVLLNKRGVSHDYIKANV